MSLDLGALVARIQVETALAEKDLVRFEKTAKSSGSKAGKVAGSAAGDGFVKGADGRLRDSKGRFVKSADDGFSAAGKRAGQRGKEAGGKFSGGMLSVAKKVVGPLAALFAIDKLKDFAKGAYEEARESQKVGKTTEAIIKATGGAAKVSAVQIGQLATKISNKSAVDDEAIQTGANLLLTFKNVRNETGKGNAMFDRATQASVDLSKAGFGSIDSAAKMLGKALNDPEKGMSALSRAGVTFTDQQKKQVKAMIKSGDTLGAQKLIMKEVEGQVGGVAAAQATAGEKMVVAWDNFKEALGTRALPVIDKVFGFLTKKGLPTLLKLADGAAIVVPKVVAFGKELGARLRPAAEKVFAILRDYGVPALAKLVTGLGKAAKFVKQNSDLIKPLAIVVGGWAAAMAIANVQQKIMAAGGLLKFLKTLSVATKTQTAVQWLLNAAMTANPIGIVITLIAALVAGFVIAYKKSDTFRKIVNGAMNGVKKVFLAVVNWVKKDFVPFFTKKIPAGFQAIVSWVKKRWPLLLGILTGPIGLAVGLIIKHRKKITAAIQDAWTWVKGKFAKLWAGAKKILLAPIEAGQKAIGKIMSAGGKLRKGFSGAKDFVAGAFRKGWDKTKSILLKPVELGRDGVSKALGAGSKLRKSFSGAKDFVGGTFRKGWAKTKGFLAGPVESGRDLIGKALGSGSKLRKAFTGVKSWAGTTWRKAFSGVKLWMSDPVQAGRNLVANTLGRSSKFRNAFSNVKTWAGTTWRKGWSKAKDWLQDPVQKGRDTIAAAFGRGSKLRNAFSNVRSWAGSTWRTGWAKAKSWLKDPIEGGRDKIATAFGRGSKLRNAFDGAKDWARNTWRGKWANVKSFLADPVGEGRKRIGAALGREGLRKTMNAADDWGRKIFGKRWAKMKDVLSKPGRDALAVFRKIFGSGGSVRTVFKGFVTAAKTIFGKVKGAIMSPIASAIKAVNKHLIKGGINWLLGKLGVDKKKQMPWIRVPKGYRTGGKVWGEGTETSDSIDARLSRNEHVWTAAEVRGAGGHSKVEKMRSAARKGRLAGFRWGGQVDGGGGGGLTRVEGGTFTAKFGQIVAQLARMVPGFRLYQGGWNPGGVSASGGTHDKDAVDYGPATRQAETAGRKLGMASWLRNAATGWTQTGAHVHGVPSPSIGDGSRLARVQYQNYLDGLNGLTGGGRDTGDRSYVGKGGSGGGGFFSDVGDFLKGLSPVEYLQKKIGGIANKITAGGVLARGLKNIPGYLLGKTKGWITDKANGFLGGGGDSDAGTSGNVQAYVRAQMLKRWPAGQWGPLKQLVQNESGWRLNATNPSSGAYGLFQSWPASKLDAYGNRHTKEAQTDFGLSYIKSAYGSPSNALAKWMSRSPHWYGRGITSAARGIQGVAENAPELVIGKQYRRFKGGETVLDPSQTKKALADGRYGSSAGGRPLHVDIHDNYLVDPDQLARKVSVKIGDAMTMTQLTTGGFG